VPAATLSGSAAQSVVASGEPAVFVGSKSRNLSSISVKAVTALAVILVVILVVGLYWRSRNAPKLTDKDTIVLADFTNTTGDPLFDGTLKQALATDLGQSPFLNILSEERVNETLRMMGRSPGERITVERAREICERTQSAAVIAGSIASVGTQFAIGTNAVNCVNGDTLAREELQASRKEDVLAALDRAASKIREKLGESLASVQKFSTPIEQATTSSLEALKAFSLAFQAEKSQGDAEAVPFLKHAIELDPNFALAYSDLAQCYGNLGEAELASEFAQKAYDRRQRASEREQFFISSVYSYTVLGDLDQEQRIYQVWRQTYPHDWEPWNNSAVNLQYFGDCDRALPEAQEAVRLNPALNYAYGNVAGAFLCLNRLDEARQTVQQALARGMDTASLRQILYQIAFLENDSKGMEAQLAALAGHPGEENLLGIQAGTEAYFGRVGKARNFFQRAAQMARQENLLEVAAQIQEGQALREAEFGNFTLAKRAATAALAVSLGKASKLSASLAFARAGDTRNAEGLANGLDKSFPSDTYLQRYWLPTIRASIELNRNNPSAVLKLLQNVPYEFGTSPAGPATSLFPAYVRGQAYLATHQGKEAATEFQKFLDRPSLVGSSPLAALARLQLGRAYALQGNTDQARTAYQDFFALWKDADPDIPILKQAKAEYAKLQ
jgi:eukaryotic-like serine/threonine-protein kinase